MKRLAVCLLCLLLVALCAFSASADTNDNIYAFVRTSKAYVYSSSSLSTSIGYLAKFDVVKVESFNSTTACISKSGKTGYMKISDLSRVDGEMTPAKLNVKAKVYSKPSTSASGSYVSKGTSVNIIAVNGSWTMIEKNGNTGYIKTSYLTKVDSAAVVTPKPTSTPAASPTPVTCNFEAFVSADTVTVYKSASTSSTKLGTLKSGAVVTVRAYNSDWAYIELNGRFGYCSRAALTKAPAATATPAPTATASPTPTPAAETLKPCEKFNAASAVEKAKVYSAPDETSDYLGYVSAGDIVEVHAYGTNWCYISLNSKYGYALISDFIKVQPTAAPTATPTPIPTATPAPTATAAPTSTAKVYPASTDPLFTDTSTTNLEKAFRFLAFETDYNEAVACGIISNFVSESSCNPKSVNSAGYTGLCQWSPSRFAILVSWCDSQDLDPYSLEGQLKFLRYDLSQRYTLYHKYLLTVENTAQGAYDAGYYFCLKYERPGNTESASVKRGNNAMNTYWPKYAEKK